MSIGATNLKKLANTLVGLSKSLPSKLKLIIGAIAALLIIVAAIQPSVSPTAPESDTNSEIIPSTNPDQLYQVDRVVDGDIIRVFINQTSTAIRLIGINTPESVDPRRPVQCFGLEASQHAKHLLRGESVYLRADPTQDDHDKYDRLLRYVTMFDGTDVNLHMITHGYAYEYTFDIPYQMQAQFEQAEQQARQQQKGLWHPNACGAGGQ